MVAQRNSDLGPVVNTLRSLASDYFSTLIGITSPKGNIRDPPRRKARARDGAANAVLLAKSYKSSARRAEAKKRSQNVPPALRSATPAQAAELVPSPMEAVEKGSGYI